MTYYKNLGGDSKVNAYEIGNDFITIQFSDGAVYLYNYVSTGSHNIEQMKKLAIAGRGLNGFININVRKKYAKKIR